MKDGSLVVGGGKIIQEEKQEGVKNAANPDDIRYARRNLNNAASTIMHMLDRGQLDPSEKSALKKAHDGVVVAQNILVDLSR
jgi:hypothetical protein